MTKPKKLSKSLKVTGILNDILKKVSEDNLTQLEVYKTFCYPISFTYLSLFPWLHSPA
jgi:hypothetical protein